MLGAANGVGVASHPLHAHYLQVACALLPVHLYLYCPPTSDCTALVLALAPPQAQEDLGRGRRARGAPAQYRIPGGSGSDDDGSKDELAELLGEESPGQPAPRQRKPHGLTSTVIAGLAVGRCADAPNPTPSSAPLHPHPHTLTPGHPLLCRRPQEEDLRRRRWRQGQEGEERGFRLRPAAVARRAHRAAAAAGAGGR